MQPKRYLQEVVTNIQQSSTTENNVKLNNKHTINSP